MGKDPYNQIGKTFATIHLSRISNVVNLLLIYDWLAFKGYLTGGSLKIVS